MRTVLCGIVLVVLSIAGVAAKEKKSVTVEGTVIEVGPSPYAKQGGLGRILLKTERNRIVFHIMKDTKIIRMVDGKAQAVKFEDLKKDSLVRATFNGPVMQSEPPQAWTIQIEIVKAAK